MSEINDGSFPWNPMFWMGGVYDVTESDWVGTAAFHLNQMKQSLIDQLFQYENLLAAKANPQVYFGACMIYNSAIVANEAILKMIGENNGKEVER